MIEISSSCAKSNYSICIFLLIFKLEPFLIDYLFGRPLLISRILFSSGNYPKEKAPRRALPFNADYDLVAIATHDPEEGQKVGEDVVHV